MKLRLEHFSFVSRYAFVKLQDSIQKRLPRQNLSAKCESSPIIWTEDVIGMEGVKVMVEAL